MELTSVAVGALAALLGGLAPAWIKEVLTSRRETRAAERADRERRAEQRRDAIEAVVRDLDKVPDRYTTPSAVYGKQRAALVSLELTLGPGDGPISDLVRAAHDDQFDGIEWHRTPADVATLLLFEWHRGEVTALGAFKRYREWMQTQREQLERDPAAFREH